MQKNSIDNINTYELLEDEAIESIVAKREIERKNMTDNRIYSLDEIKAMFSDKR